MVDPDRLRAAYETARCDLMACCEPQGHWVGHLASSALSTATAVSALAIAERHASTNSSGQFCDEQREGRLSQLIVNGLHWLARHQNANGGWGDTDKSVSNIATTMLVKAAFHLTCVPAERADMLERAERYIRSQGGIEGLRRRYGDDRTFAAPILANCALAGFVPWREVPALPFELACFPRRLWNRLRLPVVSYAMPALVAIGLVRFQHRKPLNPLARALRSAATEPSLRLVEAMQPASGGFLEATPLTSFVVMSLASIGKSDHAIVRRGLQFLVASARPDGSWPIDTNLATWNTTLAVNALGAAGEDCAELDCVDWLLECQHRTAHAYTGAQPGGWAWTDLSGGVPDVDDTAGAVLALARFAGMEGEGGRRKAEGGSERWGESANTKDVSRITRAAADGARWLLDLQNRDGGWPTFCRGWGKLPFDRSGCDLTAHALRALQTWRGRLADVAGLSMAAADELDLRIDDAIRRGIVFLLDHQQPDGRWLPLWFGNQHQGDQANPIYGTARVLAAFRDLGKADNGAVERALDYLISVQNSDGGWGGKPANGKLSAVSSVEETALAAECLLAMGWTASHQTSAEKGLTWLIDAVEANRHQESSPIGFYFAQLWYYERLYPLVFAVAALGQAARRRIPQTDPAPASRLAQQK